MNNSGSKFCCRACGLFQGEDYPPWGEYGDCPSFDICICCGVEFGFDDHELELIQEYREEWFEKGATWRFPKYKPENWSLEEQMENIPEEFR